MQQKTELNDISSLAFLDEERAVRDLLAGLDSLSLAEDEILGRAVEWTNKIRESGLHGSVESFLQAYSLSSGEGVALMSLAEALLRIPDKHTADSLIRSTFEGRNWGGGAASSGDLSMIASKWGLVLTGKIVELGNDPHTGIMHTLKNLVSKAGEPLIREALKKATAIIGGRFVLGETVSEAIKNSRQYSNKGYNFSFDMLGEGARSDKQARGYVESYKHCIAEVGKIAAGDAPLFKRPGVSVKLSALHPQYKLIKRERVLGELLPRLIEIMFCAKQAGIAVSIDAEESSRLDIELMLFEKLLKIPELAGWSGIGFVLQAYNKRAFYIIDFLAEQARIHKRVIPLRLVKGAYWDSEIKQAQLAGLLSYPVFTRKEYTDISYLACADKIFGYGEEFYPQFATHNARTISSVIYLSKKHGRGKDGFEFQRLYGMGDALHDIILADYSSRIYAPIGEHKDLPAYLIRRLLENGANSSFVQLLADKNKAVDEIIADPITLAKSGFDLTSIPLPSDIYLPHRKNSGGVDFGNSAQLRELLDSVAPFAEKPLPVISGSSKEDVARAIGIAKKHRRAWSQLAVDERSKILERCADLLEKNRYELIGLCVKEAGKTLPDCVAELREAVDFCRYYAAEARRIMREEFLPSPTGESNMTKLESRGVFVCISPWNFPLAIFIGQAAAALAAGNCVIAKSAEQTPVIAKRAVEILYEAGIPREVLHLIIGSGEEIGAALVASENIDGVVFTGGTQTAKIINQSLAQRAGAIIPLIAETGGQNCMVVDSSALLEQAVDDIIISAFGSAGQRCSALRVLYVQEEIADKLLDLLSGAMQELKLGNPLAPDTDIGQVIDASAKEMLENHIDKMKKTAKFIAQSRIPQDMIGNFVAPHAFEINNIAELEREIFGPVLHVIRFKSDELANVAEEINSTGYGLTFGIHSRIGENIAFFSQRVRAGNIYVNRSMIGATVGVQPFGGEGLSGTGFKAGGKNYLLRFLSERTLTINTAAIGGNISLLAGK